MSLSEILAGQKADNRPSPKCESNEAMKAIGRHLFWLEFGLAALIAVAVTLAIMAF